MADAPSESSPANEGENIQMQWAACALLAARLFGTFGTGVWLAVIGGIMLLIQSIRGQGPTNLGPGGWRRDGTLALAGGPNLVGSEFCPTENGALWALGLWENWASFSMAGRDHLRHGFGHRLVARPKDALSSLGPPFLCQTAAVCRVHHGGDQSGSARAGDRGWPEPEDASQRKPNPRQCGGA